jgi:pyruvate-formate lyase-activating enzyme
MRAIAECLRGSGVRRVELLPYHDTAVSKYRALGLDCRMDITPPPGKETMQQLRLAVAGEWEVV